MKQNWRFLMILCNLPILTKQATVFYMAKPFYRLINKISLLQIHLPVWVSKPNLYILTTGIF